MDHTGTIEIRVSGQIGSVPVSPDNFDISQIKELFDAVEDMLYPAKKNGRPPITYTMEVGSVRNIFHTTMQSATAFIAVAAMVSQSGSLDGLELPTARALSRVQELANSHGLTYEFGAKDTAPVLVISRDTDFHIDETIWADGEFYFYGTLVNAGGKDKANIHLSTKTNGVLIISADKEYIKTIEENMLYREYTARTRVRQNVVTGELDTSTLQLLDLTPYRPDYNEEYINRLIKMATPHWADVEDSDRWLAEIRGIDDYE